MRYTRKRNQVTTFYLFSPFTQLPVISTHTHIHNLLTLYLDDVDRPSSLAPFSWVVEIPPPPQEMVEVPPPPQGTSGLR